MNRLSEVHDQLADPAVRGFLHQPASSNGNVVVLTHGAGGNCNARLLLAVAEAFTDAGFVVLRMNLPFRQRRPFGPPSPATAALDRRGLQRAVELMKTKFTSGKLFLSGHSYGGRQSTMLVAENSNLVDGLLLFSYPLHPPRKPEQLRTAHFPQLTTPSLFVHGSRDPFGLLEEMRPALELIPARHELLAIEGGGHDLIGKKPDPAFPAIVINAFRKFFSV